MNCLRLDLLQQMIKERLEVVIAWVLFLFFSFGSVLIFTKIFIVIRYQVILRQNRGNGQSRIVP